jgi:hypothetical protein
VLLLAHRQQVDRKPYSMVGLVFPAQPSHGFVPEYHPQ